MKVLRQNFDEFKTTRVIFEFKEDDLNFIKNKDSFDLLAAEDSSNVDAADAVIALAMLISGLKTKPPILLKTKKRKLYDIKH